MHYSIQPDGTDEKCGFNLEINCISCLVSWFRLDITSSNLIRWDRNPNTGHDFGEDQEKNLIVAQQTILHNKEHPSAIILPIITRS
ncbi:hypothetical protein [Shimazuella alba]|uniref:Uncharacterized protein n=1 Tax=Shimazuella alba TaxID=2690964 RepID=A0A6I4VMW1_9BACL|nr:hypothetical protein [Shimazuella alba]MXQ52949.1 hypothetical protein [Shimazuella alba]